MLLIYKHSLTGSTLVSSYSLLSTEVFLQKLRHFQMVAARSYRVKGYNSKWSTPLVKCRN